MVLNNTYNRWRNSSIYWFHKAKSFQKCSEILWENIYSNNSDNKQHSLTPHDTPTILMLWGLSLELLYKAIIVSQKGNFKEIHKLDKLAKDAGFNYNKTEDEQLSMFTDFHVWYGRYPIAKGKKKNNAGEKMDSFFKLTDRYLHDEVQFGRPKIKRRNTLLERKIFYKFWDEAINKYENLTTQSS